MPNGCAVDNQYIHCNGNGSPSPSSASSRSSSSAHPGITPSTTSTTVNNGSSNNNNGNGRSSSSSQYRAKALQEIRISLMPYMNGERPMSSASSASDASSSPGQTSGIGSSISSTSNQSYSCIHNIPPPPPPPPPSSTISSFSSASSSSACAFVNPLGQGISGLGGPIVNGLSNVGSICGSVASSTNSNATNGSSKEFSPGQKKLYQLMLSLGCNDKQVDPKCSRLSSAQQHQLAKHLQGLSLHQHPSSSINNSANQAHISSSSYPHSPPSLSSLYSSISSPPPSYAASSSSGRQSPTSTVSSSSEYACLPPPPPPNAYGHTYLSSASSASSTCSSRRATPQTPSSCPGGGGAAATVVSSVIRASHIQAWGARQAKSQSPVIMQSVKSTQVQKPVLQTAIAPTAPPVTPVQATFSTTSASSHVKLATTQPSVQQQQHTQQQQAVQNCYPVSYTSVSNGSASMQAKLHTTAAPSANNPPPYPLSSQRISAAKSQNAPQLASAYAQNHAIPPPPPYSSAVQQHSHQSHHSHQHVQPQQQQQQQTFQAQTQQHPQPQMAVQPQAPSQVHGVRNVNYEDSHPPPPPPPPYGATFQIITNEPDSLCYPIVNSRQAGPGVNGIHIPTTDPPSYASSVSALAVQRAVAPVVTTVNGTSSKVHQIPARPPPPLPPNSDLVNTVESICASQVGPPLPAKPINAAQFNDAASVISATESDCSSTSTSTCNAYPVHVSGPRRPAPPPPPSPPSKSPPCFESAIASTNGNNGNSRPMEKPESTSNYKTTHQSPIPPRKPLSKEKERERREAKVRNYSPAAFKFYMEQHVENIIKSQQERESRRQQLEMEMAKVGLSEEAQKEMRKMLHQKESNYIRLKRAKMEKSMFVKLKAIGVGAFGEVALVKKKGTQQLYAMKTLRKNDVLKRNQVAHVKAERDILAEADNEWVVKLYYSFQDSDYLYFVMDYIPGGDLMSLLIKFGIFEESLARFYIAELVLAVESVHKMGFIHRDIKPDNILIDRDGHIKLTDFGLCTGFRWTHNSKYYQRNNGVDHSRQDSMEMFSDDRSNQCHCLSNSNKPLERRRRREHQRCQAHSLVGTPNYIAPEVLMRTGYTQSCDWWSVGVILYEMLVGQPPFLANTPEETQHKVINWRNSLHIPKEAELSPAAIDLILKLCCGPEERLGRNGADEIKQHPFFEGIDFSGGLRKQPAPYIPSIRHPTDTSNFDPIDPDRLLCSENGIHGHDEYDSSDRYENGKHPEHAFFEFTFRRFFDDGGQAYPLKISLDGNEVNSPINEAGQGSPVYV